MRKRLVRRLFAALAIAVIAAVVMVLVRKYRSDDEPTSSPAPSPQREAVTAGEREAAWSAAATQRLLNRQAADLANRITQSAMIDEQLSAARRLLAGHTATSNENLRLRGAVEALTEAMAALHAAAATSTREGGIVSALEGEVEALRTELQSMELQIKELAEERDRAVAEAESLRSTGSLDDGVVRRLQGEISHIRRSLDVERQRNLRLGRRGLDHWV